MFWKHDPGPCPVDDAPHHTCVGPSPQGNNAPPQPPRNDPNAPTMPRVIGATTSTARSVTTKTYTRAWWCAQRVEGAKQP